VWREAPGTFGATAAGTVAVDGVAVDGFAVDGVEVFTVEAGELVAGTAVGLLAPAEVDGGVEVRVGEAFLAAGDRPAPDPELRPCALPTALPPGAREVVVAPPACLPACL
jgi:hypothetical protein